MIADGSTAQQVCWILETHHMHFSQFGLQSQIVCPDLSPLLILSHNHEVGIALLKFNGSGWENIHTECANSVIELGYHIELVKFQVPFASSCLH